MADDELRELATVMALTMPLDTPEQAALARRVEERQAEWERLWKWVFEKAAEVHDADASDGIVIVEKVDNGE